MLYGLLHFCGFRGSFLLFISILADFIAFLSNIWICFRSDVLSKYVQRSCFKCGHRRIGYEDGKREIFEAIYLTEYGEIIFGQILYGSIEDCPGFFREYGGIPKDNIKSIEGGSKKIVVNNCFNRDYN